GLRLARVLSAQKPLLYLLSRGVQAARCTCSSTLAVSGVAIGSSGVVCSLSDLSFRNSLKYGSTSITVRPSSICQPALPRKVTATGRRVSGFAAAAVDATGRHAAISIAATCSREKVRTTMRGPLYSEDAPPVGSISCDRQFIGLPM